MPVQQIRKHKNKRSSRRSGKSGRVSRRQRGGDPGRVALPMAYFSKNSTPGYYPDGDAALQGCPRQKAVSHGVVWPGGNWAGPNLYPQLGGKRTQRGGGCGCNGSRRNKSKRNGKTQIRHRKH